MATENFELTGDADKNGEAEVRTANKFLFSNIKPLLTSCSGSAKRTFPQK